VNKTEALTAALVLAVTAPTDEQSDKALALADQLAAGLSRIEVQRCKKDAEKQLEGMRDV
jgi:hypothetical protein